MNDDPRSALERPLPRRAVPPLRVPTLEGAAFDVAAPRATRFVLVAMYRGLHCPICKAYLRELDQRLPDLAARRTSAIAISVNGEGDARAARDGWRIASLPIGYDLSIETGRQWGLYVSRGRPGTTEPAMFCEPGFFIVESDATLYWAATASMPFARPRVDDVLHALDAIVERGYPARGEA
jgi:peroxiredoxin